LANDLAAAGLQGAEVMIVSLKRVNDGLRCPLVSISVLRDCDVLRNSYAQVCICKIQRLRGLIPQYGFGNEFFKPTIMFFVTSAD